MASTSATDFQGARVPKATTAVDNIAACDSCRRTSWTCVGGPVCEKCALLGFDCMYTAGDAIADLKREFELLLLPGSPIPPLHNFLEAESKRVGETASLANGSTAESFLKDKSSSDDTLELSDPCLASIHQQIRKCCCSRCSRRFVVSDPDDEKTRLCPRCRTRRCKASYRSTTEASESRLRTFIEERSRPRSTNACDSCRSLNFKCNEVQPCYTCRTNGTNCTYSPTYLKTSRSSSPRQQTSHSTAQRLLTLQDQLPRRGADSLPLPPYHSSAPPLAYESLLGPPIAYNQQTGPLTSYTSVPSGCTSCFESKTRCSRPSGFPCERCTSLSLQCSPFPAGTRLTPCGACTQAKRLCTNVQKGLSCDGCVDRGVDCSRLDTVGAGSVTMRKAVDRAGFLIGPDGERGGFGSSESESEREDLVDPSLRKGLPEVIEQEGLREQLSEDEGGFDWCMVTYEDVSGV